MQEILDLDSVIEALDKLDKTDRLQVERLKKRRDLTVAKLATAGRKEVERKAKAVGYQTPPFKCYDDYNKCRKKDDSPMCTTLMLICLGRLLIPFAKLT